MDNIKKISLMTCILQALINPAAISRWNAYIPENANDKDIEHSITEYGFDALKNKFNEFYLSYIKDGINTNAFTDEQNKFLSEINDELGRNKSVTFNDRDYVYDILTDCGINETPEQFCKIIGEKICGNKQNYEKVLPSILKKYLKRQPNIHTYNTFADFHNCENIYPIEKFDEICSTFSPHALLCMAHKGNFNPNASKYFTFENNALININENELMNKSDFNNWYMHQQFDDIYNDSDFSEDILNGALQLYHK